MKQVPNPKPVDSVAPLAEIEWNFDSVPDKELVACIYWEYARESAFIRDTLQKFRESCLAGEGWTRANETYKNLERIQSIGAISKVFVRGCTFEPGGVYQSTDPDKPRYRNPGGAVLSGSFPNPWLSLSRAERRERSRIRRRRAVIPHIPIKRGEWEDAQEIAIKGESSWREVYDAYVKVRQDNPGLSELQLIEQGKLKPFPDIELSLFSEDGAEITVLAIQWSHFTNEELVRYFRSWVKANRPKQLRNPDPRGYPLTDWRTLLTRLAVLRLLSRFTARGLVTDNLFPEIWKTKQFSARKWTDVSKWQDARRDARNLFLSMFPFLPKGELPLSWTRLERS